MQEKALSRNLISKVVPWLLLFLAAAFFFSRFLPANNFLIYFDDDFFYYLVVAKHIVAGQGSTFDGSHLTNGYHPLWMLVIVCLVKLFPGKAFFYAVVTVMTGSVMATYAFAFRCFRRYLSSDASAVCAALIAGESLLFMGGGMEIVLTVPLIAALCLYRLTRFQWNVRSAMVFGLLVSAVVLSRLDSILFVTTLCLLELGLATGVPVGTRVKAADAFLVGTLPLVGYLASNLFIYHTLVPVSATAKQLRISHTPSYEAWRIAFSYPWPIPRQLDRPVVAGVLLAVAFLLVRGRERLLPEHRALVWALMLFPFLQLSSLSLLSDWPIWNWYHYPFVVAGLAVVLVLGTRTGAWAPRLGRLAVPLVGLAALLLTAKSTAHAVRSSLHHDSELSAMLEAGQALSGFAATHPGIYAMGDRAGIVGYLVDQPIVQLEGLMMDKAFLERIREQRDVVDTLKAYGVRYYIATDPKPANGCVAVREPVQAGATSKVMRGTLCEAPVYAFAFHGTRTLVFDMGGQYLGARSSR